jgi:hypothetical protein
MYLLHGIQYYREAYVISCFSFFLFAPMIRKYMGQAPEIFSMNIYQVIIVLF